MYSNKLGAYSTLLTLYSVSSLLIISVQVTSIVLVTLIHPKQNYTFTLKNQKQNVRFVLDQIPTFLLLDSSQDQISKFQVIFINIMMFAE